MRFKLFYHPLSSFCWKALIALYEAEAGFDPMLVNLGDPGERAAFLKLWPIGKFPVLVDTERRRTVPESSVIIEYLALHGGGQDLIPSDPDQAFEARALDRFFDLNIHVPMQKVTTDVFRPEGANDPFGVEQARGQIDTAYGLLEAKLAGRAWAAGGTFTLADCAAAPALFYGNLCQPIGEGRPGLKAYLGRLMSRPSFARVLSEAEPFFQYYPLKDRIPETYPELTTR